MKDNNIFDLDDLSDLNRSIMLFPDSYYPDPLASYIRGHFMRGNIISLLQEKHPLTMSEMIVAIARRFDYTSEPLALFGILCAMIEDTELFIKKGDTYDEDEYITWWQHMREKNNNENR